MQFKIFFGTAIYDFKYSYLMQKKKQKKFLLLYGFKYSYLSWP